MKEIKKIMVPIDGSVESRHALEYAIYMAKLCEAEMYLAAVVDLNRFLSKLEFIEANIDFVSVSGCPTGEAQEKGKRRLDKVLPLIPEGITVHEVVKVGNPSETLLDLSECYDIDMVIMGRRGKSTLERLSMGSVSQYMVSNAHCPVLVVK